MCSKTLQTRIPGLGFRVGPWKLPDPWIQTPLAYQPFFCLATKQRREPKTLNLARKALHKPAWGRVREPKTISNRRLEHVQGVGPGLCQRAVLFLGEGGIKGCKNFKGSIAHTVECAVFCSRGVHRAASLSSTQR